VASAVMRWRRLLPSAWVAFARLQNCTTSFLRALQISGGQGILDLLALQLYHAQTDAGRQKWPLHQLEAAVQRQQQQHSPLPRRAHGELELSTI